jgi:hypothetical protein
MLLGGALGLVHGGQTCTSSLENQTLKSPLSERAF